MIKVMMINYFPVLNGTSKINYHSRDIQRVVYRFDLIPTFIMTHGTPR